MPIYALDGQAPDLPQEGRYWIAPDATVIGRVRLGEDASVWFGCVLRGDNEWISIGARTNVQENTVMHTDMGAPLTVGDGCTIGHCVMLHGCSIGDGSLIGIGATVLNHARIGRNCLVGAHSLVTEGKEFPDNSLIMGSPARVVRTLDEDALSRLAKSSQGYVRNWQRFSKGLTRIG
jgi:carbonic anhydrase/acetyltransferase-like protein (isoleucine patch superfamily)